MKKLSVQEAQVLPGFWTYTKFSNGPRAEKVCASKTSLSKRQCQNWVTKFQRQVSCFL